ncbi:hypothetical protein BDF20DRAFT_290842 [Mycotypha africana]|uniref:uncharacterized protein n=1 Tax=Mycotypha africana TaxID=64632 RepID=UPI002301C4A0|nr:uncharacterized protein BDF20DRAFT_290842 [Mycotypha africana]KAI8987818.1 hypothetical protein BDF20DRAFT_290842 [Mycotypha africana]
MYIFPVPSSAHKTFQCQKTNSQIMTTGNSDLFGFDFSDDDFETKERQTVKFMPDGYQPKIETDGWFHEYGNNSIDDVMLEQHGPNQIRSSIEHDYFYKNYDRALSSALAFIRVAKYDEKCKVTGLKEITDIAMHCAAKLNKLDLLNELLDYDPVSLKYHIYVYTKYTELGRYTEAMVACICYHKERKLDYRVWAIMADIFMKSASSTSTVVVQNEMRYHLANLSMQRAIHIVKNSRWKNNIDFVRRRFEKDVAGLENRLQETIQKGGNADKFAAWMATAPTEDDKDAAGLADFKWDDIVWIYQDWAVRTDIILDDDTIRAVKDM